ncbi:MULTISPECIES: hypothetical protein [Bacteria]|uniref:hypothetical protein n=1 Tax=Bacteria TaxID=2 RepID=UPI003C7A2C13
MISETSAEAGVALWTGITDADSDGDPVISFVWDPAALKRVPRANIVRGTAAGVVVQSEGITLEKDEALLVVGRRLSFDPKTTRVVTAQGECWDVETTPRVRRSFAAGTLTSARLKRSAAVIP